MPLLSDFAQRLGIEIIRDGHFDHLGKIPTNLSNLIVPVKHEKYIRQLATNENIVGVITTADIVGSIPGFYAVAISEKPINTLYHIHDILCATPGYYWTSFETNIPADADIHPTAHVSDVDVKIGQHASIGPNATILPRTIIGDDVTIRAGVVIGTEAFEIITDDDGKSRVAPQAGGVKIGNRVELQANTAVTRSIFGGFTEIGDDSCTDNLVHIAHDVSIGRRCKIAASAMISGRVHIGDDVWIGPGASISNGISIGDGAHITIGAVVIKDVGSHSRVSGNFAIDHRRFVQFIRKIR